MNKILLIIQREYLSRVRKKSFLIMTLLTPFLMAGIVVVPAYLAMNSEEERHIAILDESGLLPPLETQNGNTQLAYISGTLEDEKSALSSGNYYALLHIPPASSLEELKDQVTIYSDQQVSLSVRGQIADLIEDKVEKIKLAEAGIDPQTLKDAHIRFHLNTIVMGEAGEESTGNTELSLGIGFVSGFLIYIFIFMYGAMVMRGVIEEKTSRIIEVIISSVKPFQLMMGKIVGVALVGLTQFVLWMILTLILTTVAEGLVLNSPEMMASTFEGAPMEKGMMMNQISTAFGGIPLGQLAFAFLFYFLGGYLLYSSLFAAVGSAVDQEADTQQFMLPITIPLVLSFIMMQFIIDNPDGSLAYWFSMIPLTSPIIMMVRIPFGVPTGELLLSMGLLITGFLFTTWIAAKIYRTGILMYGKKVSYKELWKWIRYKG
tara:strand:- start:501 stop:1796 length:1296 start_codon:yes stop_codon:yes gene_type:complete